MDFGFGFVRVWMWVLEWMRVAVGVGVGKSLECSKCLKVSEAHHERPVQTSKSHNREWMFADMTTK